MSSSDLIRDLFLSSSSLKSAVANDSQLCGLVLQAAETMGRVIAQGGTIYSCGNGGSSCDAMHLTEEFVARYKRERPGIRAMHFGDASTLTCWSNDYEYSSAFARQAETFCTAQDCLVGFSTSGRSANVNRAVQAARGKGCFTIGLTGKGGGELRTLADIAIVVPSDETERIQEVHITIVHIVLELIERAMLRL